MIAISLKFRNGALKPIGSVTDSLCVFIVYDVTVSYEKTNQSLSTQSRCKSIHHVAAWFPGISQETHVRETKYNSDGAKRIWLSAPMKVMSYHVRLSFGDFIFKSRSPIWVQDGYFTGAADSGKRG